MTVIKNVSTC